MRLMIELAVNDVDLPKALDLLDPVGTVEVTFHDIP